MTRSKTLASTRSKLLRSTPLAGGTLAAMCLMAAPASAQPAVDALPTGQAVADQSGGDAITFAVNGGTDTLTVDLGDNEQSIINWTTFDVGADADVDFTVDFVAQGAVLNRVIGGAFSQIYGGINGPSNLTVFLINTNGIVFGPTGAANVGGLISSTLDLADADFMNGSAYNFTGAATTGVTVMNGATLTTAGPLVLLGGFVTNAGALTAGGDVVMAAASDVSMTLAAGSPLSMTISQGTPITGGVVAGGTVSGRNVYLAVASRAGVLDALLNVSGTVTADTVAATDRGIVLAAGTSATGVTVLTGGGNDTSGATSITLSGSLDADDDENGDVADIELRSTGSITGAGTIDSEDIVTVVSGANITLTSADAIDAGDGITVTAAGAAEVTNADTLDGNLALTGATVALNSSTLAADDGNIVITGATAATGTSSVTAAGAGSTVTFANAVEGGGNLSVSSVAGTTFQSSVGAVTPLTSLSITGPATLNGSAMRANNGITTDNLALGFAGLVTIDADADNNATGVLAIGGDDLTKTGGGTTSVTLGGASITVDDVTGFDDVTFENNASLGGNVSAADDILFSGTVTLAGGGEDQSITGDQVTFSSTVDGGSDLTITAPTGVTFNGSVGATSALGSLDVVGPTTLNAATIQANGDIDLDAVTVGALAAVSIIADDNASGTGTLTVSGDLVSSIPGMTNLILSGDQISVANVGIGGAFANITFSGFDNASATTLSGDIEATGHLQVDTDLVLTGAGDRSISAGTATFGNNSQDDISSDIAGETGLAVSVPGALDFNGDIGTAANPLSAFGVSANSVDFDAIDAQINADVLAINVVTGNIVFDSGQDLVIGVVGPVSGLSTGDGFINVTLASPGPSTPDLTINGEVSAFGDVTLSVEGDISGSANISSGVGNAVSGADVLLVAGGDVSVGNVASNDDIVIDVGGSLTAGSLTTGNIDSAITGIGDAHVGQLLSGGDVVASADGIAVGAINVTSDITLDGGATGIGLATQDLSLFAPGNITLIGDAIGIDVAINAGGAVTTQDITARDDVAVFAQTGVASVGDVTSGTTVNGQGPTDAVGAADTLFPVLDFTGNDVAIAGNGLNFGAVLANGAGSDIRVDSLSGVIGAGTRDLDLNAGGDIVLFDNVQGLDIALVAGGSISGGVGLVNVTARDDIAIIAGGTATFGTLTVGATVDALGATNVDGAADPHLPGSFTATGNDMVLESQELSATYSLTGVDDFALTDTMGGLTLNTGITVGGQLQLTAENGDLTIGAVTLSTTGDITLTTVTSGDILLNNATIVTDPGAPAPNFGNSTVTLISAGMVNQSGGSITTNELDGSSVGDAILFGNNTLKKFSFDAGGALGLFSQSGFDIDEPIDAGSGIFLFTPQFINILAGGALETNGTISLSAGTFIAIGDDIDSMGNPIELFAGTTINQTAGAITGSTLTGSSGGATSLTGANNDIDTLGSFTAAGFAYTDANALTVVGPISGGAGATAITAGGALAINGTVSGTGVTLTSDSDGIALAADVNAGAGTLDLNADDDVTQTAGTLTAATLTGTVGGATDLTASVNQFTNLGAFTSNGFALLDGGGLTVTGPVDGGAAGLDIETSGVLTVNGTLDADNGPIALDATGAGADILFNAAVDAGTGAISLNSGGAISQTAAGTIAGGSLSGSSVGATTLNVAANQLDDLGPFTASGFALLNAAALTVSGDVSAGGGALSIQVNGNPLTVNADLTGSQVTLVATGIDQAAGSVIDGGAGTVSLDANDGSVDLMGGITTTNATATAVTIIDAANAVLGDITTGAGGTLTLGGAAGDSISGDVTQTADTAIVIGTLTGNVGGTATLMNAGNQVANLGAFTAGSLALNDSSGGLVITDNVTVTNELELHSAGVIDQTAGIITAGTLSGSSVGGASFDAPGNVIAGLGAFTNTGGGGFTLVTTVGLTMTGDFDAGTGDLSLTAPGIDFTDQTVTAGGNIVLDGLAGDLTGGTVTAGGGIIGTGAMIDIDSADANGGALDLTSAGDLNLGAGSASGAVTLTAAGALTGGDIDAGADLTGTGTSIDLASATAGGALSLTTDGDLTLGGGGAGTTATLIGAMVTLGGFDGGSTVSIEAEDLDIDGAVSAGESVDITNAGTGVTALGSASEGGFSLAEAEINNISAPTLTIQSGANAIAIGDLAFATGAGSDRVNLLTSGRIDVTGTVTADGSPTSREFQIGGTDADTGESSVIRIAATAEGGGRLLMDQAVLHLRGAKIGVGQDAEFLEAIGLGEGGTPLGVDQVAQDYVADAQSTLYVPATPYDFNNNVLVSASSMTVTYADYALFQNTSLPGTIPGGVVIGSAEVQGTLTLNSSGSNADNAFSMSGEINGRRGVEAAVLGPNFIIINDVNLNNSRLNGCLVGSGGNCIINIVATPFFQFFDESRADVLSAGRDLTLTLDPLVGANNEALFSGISSVDDPAEDECPPDSETPCPAEEGNDQ